MSLVFDTLEIENFGPIQSGVIRTPTPMHALIGPNESGKSTVLRAIHAE
jgi:predicted ATP-dependent endonuclease of OLD family